MKRNSANLVRGATTFATILAGLTMAVVQAEPAAAMSSARTALAAKANELVLSCTPYAQPQVFGTMRSLFSQVGVSTAGWNSVDDIAASSFEIGNVTVSESDGGPAPGDVAVFSPELGYAPTDMAIFVTNGDVIVWDATTRRFQNVPLAALDGASTKSTTMPYAQKGSVLVYRIKSSRWPGGHDDTSIAPGHIELVTPNEMTKQMNWVVSHPRDPDQSFWHGVFKGVTAVVAWVSGVLGAAVGFLLNAGSWLLHHTWIFGAAGLALIGILTKHFDGSFFNRVLTIAVGWPILGLLGVLRAAATALGLRGLASVLGSLNSAAFNGISFVISVFTGLQGEGESSLGGVLIALVSDYVLVLKPLAASAKAAELYGALSARYTSMAVIGERVASLRALLPAGALSAGLGNIAAAGKAAILGRYGLVALASKTNDLVMLRPSTVFDALRIASKASVGRVADVFSWIWRPQSVMVEGVEHAESFANFVGANAGGAKEVADKIVPVLQKTNALLHNWSAGSHLTYVASTGHTQTVPPPENLRPSELLRARINHLDWARP